MMVCLKCTLTIQVEILKTQLDWAMNLKFKGKTRTCDVNLDITDKKNTFNTKKLFKVTWKENAEFKGGPKIES